MLLAAEAKVSEISTLEKYDLGLGLFKIGIFFDKIIVLYFDRTMRGRETHFTLQLDLLLSGSFPLCILPGKVRHIVTCDNMNISSAFTKNFLIYDYFTVSRILV